MSIEDFIKTTDQPSAVVSCPLREVYQSTKGRRVIGLEPSVAHTAATDRQAIFPLQVVRRPGMGDKLFAIAAVHQLLQEKPDADVTFSGFDTDDWLKQIPWLKVGVNEACASVVNLDNVPFDGRNRCKLMGQALGVDVTDIRFPINVPKKKMVDGKYFVFVPFANAVNPRSFPIETARAVLANSPIPIAFSDRMRYGDFELGENVVNCTGTDMLELMALVAGSEGVISCDTGTAWLAAVLDKPVMVFYGHVGPAESCMVSENVLAVQSGRECDGHPCGDRIQAQLDYHNCRHHKPLCMNYPADFVRYMMEEFRHLVGSQVPVIRRQDVDLAVPVEVKPVAVAVPVERAKPLPQPVVVKRPDGPIPPYTVVIPWYNNANMTKRCVDAVVESGTPAEIITVNDGSTKGRYNDHRVKQLKLNRNYGFPFAVNYGVAAAKNEFVVVINNDVTMFKGGFEKLLRELKDPSVAMVGQTGKRLKDDFDTEDTEGAPDYIEMSVCAFRKSVWDKVGGLDDGFGRGYYEDVDFCFRARKAGYRLAVAQDCGHHAEGQTFGRGKDVEELVAGNKKRFMEKHYRGKCLWVMASIGINGGSKVAFKLASAMQDDGWKVDVCSFRPWSETPAAWNRFGHVEQSGVGEYDVVVSTFHTTMPFAASVKSKHWFGLIQSDEPAWDGKVRSPNNFEIRGCKAVVIADHMQEFREKYGMNIVGQIANGVDSVVFHPTWLFERKWPHSLLLIRKSSSVWYDGAQYAEAAVKVLAERYRDLEVVVLGGQRPNWPCKVRHVRTYDEREIRDLYNSVSCVVVPSLIEGCSLVPLEAMASGCPCISTRVGMDYAEDGSSYLLVPYKDAGAIAEAVGRVFDDAGLRERLSKNGLKIAHSRTWEKQQSQWLEIVDKETA